MQKSIIYEEWLTTIANTRLIYKTMTELEDMLDNHSIHSNGIRRCYSSTQKKRSAFRDLMVEVSQMTEDNVSLDSFLKEYKEAWIFYKKHLARRANPEKTAMEILHFCYPPYIRDGYSDRKMAIYTFIIEQEISVPILLMLLMRALPGYDSKGGDVDDLEQRYDEVMTLLERYTKADNSYEVLPVIKRARGENHKSRVMLYYYILLILDVFHSLSNSAHLYDMTAGTKNRLVDIDIDGVWNECGGRLEYTSFWQIEKAINEGVYFVYFWHKDANNQLVGLKYTCNLLDNGTDELIACLTHPEAMKRRIEGVSFIDADNAWYKVSLNIHEDKIVGLKLTRDITSDIWPLTISLTRVTEQSVMDTYEHWMDTCSQHLRFAEYEYTFSNTLYAITKDYLYISSDVESEYFRIPKSSHDGFEKIKFDDNVGTMVMGGKLYIVIDELMMYIKTTPQSLKKFNIIRVKEIT